MESTDCALRSASSVLDTVQNERSQLTIDYDG